jgi:RND family efflux transporter MFP subunit
MTTNDLTQLHIDKTRLPDRRLKRWGWAVLLLILLISCGYLYSKGLLSPSVEVQTVSVQRIYPSQTLTVLNASGYVVAQRKAAVSSKITGKLVYLAVEEGSRVKEGDIIAHLENDDMLASRDRSVSGVKSAQHNLEQASADLDEATLSYQRSQELVLRGYIARSEFDLAEARYKRLHAAVASSKSAVSAARASLKEIDVNLDYAVLRAPFDAVVLTKNADVGDIITPLGAAANAKAAVVNLADMHSLQVEVDVAESNIEKVYSGQPCEITLDAISNERFPGSVHMIVPTADRTKASILVKIAFNQLHAKILPEMSAKAAFLQREIQIDEMRPMVVVPVTAVLNRNQQSTAYKISDDRAIRIQVTIGRTMNDILEILSGLNIGDKIINSPSDKVQDGTKIKFAK